MWVGVFLAALTVAASVFGVLAPQVQAAVPANGRAWELVTESQPSSTRSLGLRPLGSSGDRILYATIGPTPGSMSGAFLGWGTAARTPSGWAQSSLGLPYHTEADEVFELAGPVYPVAFSANEETILWSASVPLVPGAPPESERRLSLYRTIGAGPPEFIAPIEKGLAFELYGFAGLSSDGGRTIFASEEHLVAADAARTEGGSLYAWEGAGVKLLDVDAGGALLSTCGSGVSRANGMSPSAGQVFFSVYPCGEQMEKVYVRNLQAPGAVEISASECTRGDCGPAANVAFASATPDGKFAYLTTTQQLTNADDDSGRDLYRYNVGTGKLSLLSGAPSAVTGEVLAKGVVPSDDGSRVYFQARGEMIPGESATGGKFLMADSGGLHLVAEAANFPLASEVQLSSDGGRALFVTSSRVLGSDTDSSNDAYLYDVDGPTLTQLSIGPVGGNGALPASIAAPSPLNRQFGEGGNLRPYYAIDEAGDRAFFMTEESLLPEDTNGRFDVYEWDGELGLVTPGYQPMKSDFGGISRDGKSVVFATNATLVPADQDGDGRDLYVARLGGGFPEEPPPQCDLASCPFPSSARLTREAPASMLPIKVKSAGLRVVKVAAKAKKGAIAVIVSVPAPGRVSGSISARNGGKKVVLAQGSARAKRAGDVRLALRLTASARRSGGGAKSGQLTVSAGSSRVSQTVKVSLP